MPCPVLGTSEYFNFPWAPWKNIAIQSWLKASLHLRDFTLTGLTLLSLHVQFAHNPPNSCDFQLYLCRVSSVSAPSSGSNSSVRSLSVGQTELSPLRVNTQQIQSHLWYQERHLGFQGIRNNRKRSHPSPPSPCLLSEPPVSCPTSKCLLRIHDNLTAHSLREQEG